ncbi:hypothetical protein AVEN_226308-1 [Araneus ventricosus]|uniref:Uncharacterized protein n=1 Tax=Araneus ventricosus TaxID=182803 RepID=A0A4Y2D9F0_ARAVE|nr:hypothetical protein AVEN_226308-1 [Araneus ventricosus]
MPKRETHPQTMTFPSPCFIVRIWYLGSKRVHWGRRIHCIKLYSIRTKQHVFAFITKKNTFLLFLVQSLCAFVHSTRALRFFIEIIRFLTGRLPFSPAA